MSFVRWFESDPFAELNRLQREMNRVFTARERAGVFPPLNVYDDGESLIVQAEMPGVDAKSLDITVTGDTLTVRGERRAPELGESVSFHRQERQFGRFQRSLTLPEAVNGDKVLASYNDGVLEVRMPRAESAKPRKIEVRAS
jgi:HSP20 family protein